MHCLLYLFMLPFLFFGLCLLLLLLSLDIDPVLFVMDFYMKYTVEVVPLCMYIVWQTGRQADRHVGKQAGRQEGRQAQSSEDQYDEQHTQEQVQSFLSQQALCKTKLFT